MTENTSSPVPVNQHPDFVRCVRALGQMPYGAGVHKPFRVESLADLALWLENFAALLATHSAEVDRDLAELRTLRGQKAALREWFRGGDSPFSDGAS